MLELKKLDFSGLVSSSTIHTAKPDNGDNWTKPKSSVI
jgi:hypothetical protein